MRTRRAPRKRTWILDGRSIYSRPAQIAVATMACVAAEEAAPGAWVPQRFLALHVGISLPSMGQIVNRLRRAGLLIARRGPSGGVKLSRPASAIALADVVSVIDGTNPADRCLLGLASCSDATPCPLHATWVLMREPVRRELARCTLEELLPATAARVTPGR